MLASFVIGFIFGTAIGSILVVWIYVAVRLASTGAKAR